MLKIFFIVYFVIGVLYSMLTFNKNMSFVMGTFNELMVTQKCDDPDGVSDVLRPFLSILTFIIVAFLWIIDIIPKKK